MKPVSKTAYYCCGVRALDATSTRPACGDHIAQRFMTPEAWALFEPFRELGPPNGSNVARHRLIDDLLRSAIQTQSDVGIVIIGAGFDTRAFRLSGGRWVELDEPSVIAIKESGLPARESPNPLTRVPIEFDHQPVEEALAPFREFERPIVVLEGVLPYLTASEVRRLLTAIRETFPAPILICDLTTLRFARTYGRTIGARLRELGAPYGRLEVEPLDLIQAAGFRLTSRESIVGCAAALGLVSIPSWVLATVLRSLRDGYTVARFE